jgi:tetratricopeptide (TPR) repeat protein
MKSDYVPAANNLAFLLAEKGVKPAEALKLAEFAKSEMPDDPTVLDTLGWVYYQQGRYKTAIEELEKSVVINPNNALANYHLGWAYYEIREFEKAREAMRKALQIDPNFPGAEEARSILGG